MSCNGCRVLRKGCSEACVLRSSLQWIESPEAQGHATVFVAKFFGRAGMLGFINAVAESQRPALFQSLLYEACGRTVNPVFGAVGLLWSGNWAVCQAAVETVLKGGSLKAAECLPFSEAMQKTHGNPSLKRPHTLTEPNMLLNAEPKRLRSLVSQEEPSEIIADAHAGCGNHAKQVRFLESDAKTSRNSEIVLSSEAPKQAQRPESCPQLVVPVARRVKPGYGLAAKFVTRDQRQASAHEQESEAHTAVELDLSLNSQAFANANRRTTTMTTERRADEMERMTTQNDVQSHDFENNLCHEEHAPCVEVGRPLSPGSFSIDSEGSVASAETTEFSISGFQSFVKDRLRQEGYHLFHLL